jgi:hypothetical protein
MNADDLFRRYREQQSYIDWSDADDVARDDEHDASRRPQKLAGEKNRKLVDIAPMILTAEGIYQSPGKGRTGPSCGGEPGLPASRSDLCRREPNSPPVMGCLPSPIRALAGVCLEPQARIGSGRVKVPEAPRTPTRRA